MDRLASCYFCGDAVDAQLEEYSLVASDRVETDRDVVLCPSCRRKLTTVIEEVLDAAAGGESIDPPAEVDLDDDPLATLEGPDEDETTTGEVERVWSGHDEPATADTSGSTDDAFDGTDETSVSDNTDDSTESEGAVEASDDASGGPEHDEGQAASDDGESAVKTTDSDGRADAAGRESDDFERAEYNKVVRLLQNREFPVEIEEITVVARSAYRIDRDTTHTILEALIDRGILEDRGDELVRA